MKKSIFISILAITLCIVLSSCSFKKNEPAQESTSTAILNTDAVSNMPTQANSETARSANNDVAVSAPTKKEDILSLFNRSLENSDSLNRTNYQRNLLYCNAKMMDRNIDICEYFPDIREAAGTADANKSVHELHLLKDVQVKKATLIRQDGTKATYSIELNNVSCDQNIQAGEGGYWGVLDFKQISSLIISSTEQVGVKGVKVGNSMNINLTEGVLTVVIDLTASKIISAEGYYKEGGTGKITYGLISVSVDLQVEQKMAYAV